MTGRGSAVQTLREPNFRWYFASRLVNGAGSAMGGIALAFAVLEVSDSPSSLGAVLAANSIPMVLFLLVGGVIADRFGRTLVIQTCNVLAGLTQLAVATLVLTGTAELWQLVALSAVNGVASAVSFPALASVLPQLVPREQLQPANVLMSMQRGALAVLGPTVGGLLVVGVGAGWAVAADGLTFLLAAALLTRVRLPPPVQDQRTSMPEELREGWRYVRSTTWLWVVVAAFCVLNILHASFNVLGPVIAVRTDIGEAGWGLVLSSGAAGLLCTTVLMLRVTLQRPLLWGMLGCALFGTPMVALGLHPDTVVVMIASFVGGAGIQVFELGWNLAMQEHVPEEMLSRAYSYDALGSFVAIPLGELAVGPVGAAFGLRDSVLACGVLYLLICVATLASRSVRELPRADPQLSTSARPAP